MPAWNSESTFFLHVGRIGAFITQRRWRQEESIHFCILITPGYSSLLRWSNHHIRQHSSALGAWRICFFCLGIHGTWFNQLGIHPLLIATYCTPGSSTSIYTARSNHNIRQTLRRSTFAPHICYDMAFALFSGQEMLLGYTWHSCTWQQRVFHKNVPSHASW